MALSNPPPHRVDADDVHHGCGHVNAPRARGYVHVRESRLDEAKPLTP